MIVNFNIGFLGHVDSGKTTLARAISSTSSTASFDKNPQSQERGITLDLGFSGRQIIAPPQVKNVDPSVEHIQLTFVDCPGHASLIRTIIGGAQIIDLMVLVVDAEKCIQTQTAECIVIGELLCKKLIVAVNKIDLLECSTRNASLGKLNTKLKKVLSGTAFGNNVRIFNISAQNGLNLNDFIDGISAHVYIPQRKPELPLIMYVDHCFPIKGQGTVCTGTVIQGKVSINDTIEIPSIKEHRKVKSIQMFRRPVQSANAGDRIGLCLTQMNAQLLERGVISEPGYMLPTYAACIRLNRINYYKFPIKSKSKFHISVGHETVMANITLFQRTVKDDIGHDDVFNISQEYIFLEELPETAQNVYVLLEFETAIFATNNATLIASKLDMDVHTTSCRLAFWGNIQWLSHSCNYATDCLAKFRIVKNKQKRGNIQRVINEHQVIVQNLFKKDSNRDLYVGKNIQLSTGENGVIECTFGQTSKVKISFPNGLAEGTLKMLNSSRANEVLVWLNFKKYIFNKKLDIIQ